LSQAAKAALSQLPGEKVNAAIAERLKAASGKSLAVLIETVGARRIDAAAELVKSIKHSDAAIREAALTALGATAGPAELRVLITEVVDATSDEDAEIAVRALQVASIRMPDREATAERLAAAMPRASAATKARLLRILGAMGGPKALQTIAAASKGDNAELQDVATRVLGEWIRPMQPRPFTKSPPATINIRHVRYAATSASRGSSIFRMPRDWKCVVKHLRSLSVMRSVRSPWKR
jgi:hypothetical protein